MFRRPRLWRAAGDLLGPVTYIDVDGTIAPTYGEKKEGMDISYKGVWGYASLIVSLCNTNVFQTNQKERIVEERGYLKRALYHEAVARFRYQSRPVQPAISGRCRALLERAIRPTLFGCYHDTSTQVAGRMNPLCAPRSSPA